LHAFLQTRRALLGPLFCWNIFDRTTFFSLNFRQQNQPFQVEMSTRVNTAAAEEVAAIEELVSDLEKRLRRRVKQPAPLMTSVSSSATPWTAS
jgi:hypothetical protein